eukprot:NODE_4134_length_1222_cov_49.165605_g3638_i0.p1 GENE.NODE_4134_length_1222_cov_49.165605_g3638_i0~~NODE_4134_length_1222_cov_49.165605_g3638_i0.p1  ORF type:complete len:368 (-),score=63.03 NODE_4134_length_1222_cov_49.165605_g3638_i0:41-1144(-)
MYEIFVAILLVLITVIVFVFFIYYRRSKRSLLRTSIPYEAIPIAVLDPYQAAEAFIKRQNYELALRYYTTWKRWKERCDLDRTILKLKREIKELQISMNKCTCNPISPQKSDRSRVSIVLMTPSTVTMPSLDCSAHTKHTFTEGNETFSMSPHFVHTAVALSFEDIDPQILSASPSKSIHSEPQRHETISKPAYCSISPPQSTPPSRAQALAKSKVRNNPSLNSSNPNNPLSRLPSAQTTPNHISKPNFPQPSNHNDTKSNFVTPNRTITMSPPSSPPTPYTASCTIDGAISDPPSPSNLEFYGSPPSPSLNETHPQLLNEDIVNQMLQFQKTEQIRRLQQHIHLLQKSVDGNTTLEICETDNSFIR